MPHLLGLTDPKEGGILVLWNVHNYLPLSRNNILEEIIFVNATGTQANVARNFKVTTKV